ncbi:PREDICTED: helicase sen1-like [Nicrophorus vespilloides]|uniref:Helicase sen1-like n=1 Tax=Nicrophorus vespilloides TaxID=110193 RepID=A0ABM1M2Y7_NICVS|nr:PREDICTED: helicase sen1-like [Nicrophorus vespilloides]
MRKVQWVLRNIFTDERSPINSEVFSIGRDKIHNIVCKNTIISRDHAKIYTLANNKLQIVNCSKTNATFVNNKQVNSHDLELQEKDEIGFGVCKADYKEKQAKAPYYIFVLEKVEHNSSIIVIDDDDSMLDSDNNESIEVTALIHNENEDITIGGNVNSESGSLPGTANPNVEQLPISMEVTASINNENEEITNKNYCLPGTSNSKAQQLPLRKEVTALINNKNGHVTNGGNSTNYCLPGTSNQKAQQLPLPMEVTAFINNKNGVIANGGKVDNKSGCLPGTANTKAEQMPFSKKLTALINNENEYVTNGVNNKNYCLPGTSNSKAQQLPLSNVVTNIPDENCFGKQIANCLPIATACNSEVNNMNPIIKVKVELNRSSHVDENKCNTNETNIHSENNQLSINNQPVIDVNMEMEDPKDDIIEIVDNDVDNDDEYDFMCSQMYIKTEECEKPDEQTKVGDDNFLHIKKEIAAMDDYDEQTFLPPIDIDCLSMDSFDLQKELEDAVREPSPVAEPELQPERISPQEANKLTNVEQQLTSKRTELIEALPQPVKRRRSSVSASVQDRKKVKLKEKTKPPTPIASTSKQDVDKIKEARKDRLKQIEQNKKTEADVPKPSTSRIRPPSVYVKVSKGRGNFLIQDNVLNPKDIPIVHRDKQYCTNYANEKYGDIIEIVLDWKFTWFRKYSSGNYQELPPVTKKPIIKMCNTFSNFKNYYDVLQPLIMVDYWFNLSSEVQDNSYGDVKASDHFYATAEVSRKKPHSEMLCTTYITSEQKCKMMHVREQNIITIATKLNRSSAEPTTLFGVVIWVKVDLIQANENIDSKYVRNKYVKLKYKITFLALVNIKEVTDNKLSIFCRYFPSFNIFLRQVTAIKLLKNSPLLDYILYPRPERYLMPSIQSRSLTHQRVNLNNEQKRAVLEASYFIMDKSDGIYLINGPPGTGKSTVITNIILEALSSPNFKGKILLLAHSNCAIDSLLTKLIQIRSELAGQSKHKMKLIRIGNRASPAVQYHTLDYLTDYNLRISVINECPQLENDYKILKQDIKELQKSHSAEPNDETYKQLTLKVNELKNFSKTYLKYRFDSKHEVEKNRVLNGASVICSTVGSCLKLHCSNFTSTIDVCILDEATQCTEPDTLIPIYLGVKKMIMVGDTKQLPAITSSMYTKTYDYHVSLFSRIKHNISKHSLNPILTLKTQYRMNPEICRFPSKVFYDNALRNDLGYKSELKELKPYIVFAQDLSHPNFYYNTNEVDLVLKLIGAISEIGGITKHTTLGIITVYSKQKELIKKALANRQFHRLLDIQCSTVDGFQGQEMDIIIFSAVRNYPNRFSSDGQRINVSFTRAKHAFYIVACKNLFDTCQIFKDVKSDAIYRNTYYIVKETTTTSLIDIIKRK